MNIGEQYRLVYRLKTRDPACALSDDPQDCFPAVCATSRMIALMELAAARMMRAELA